MADRRHGQLASVRIEGLSDRENGERHPIEDTWWQLILSKQCLSTHAGRPHARLLEIALPTLLNSQVPDFYSREIGPN